MKAFWNNPLLIKELREEMRSKKIFFLVPVYIAFLSIVSLIAIGSNTGVSFNPMSLANDSRITMYSFVVTITILLGLISTVFGASTFTIEREKATYELLELTPLSYAELVLGKFLHSFTIIGLILLSSLPVFSTLFFMGGLAYVDLLLTFFYLMIFLGAVVLGTICISIVSSRTILSIILSLAAAFVISLTVSISSTLAFRDARWLGFTLLSPWLVTWQQIFSPTPVKLAGIDVPLWPLYLSDYLLLGLLFITWSRNALDSRKLERNPWARILGLLLVNGYVAIGMLCFRSYAPIREKNVEDFFEFIMLLVIAVLPFFALGQFTDKDQIRFQRKPLWETFNPARMMINYPATGLPFLILILVSVSINLILCTGLAWFLIFSHAATIVLWVLPWILIFAAMRLFHFRPRGLFVTYLLVTLFYTIVLAFQNTGTTTTGPVQFFLATPVLGVLCGISLVFYVIARYHSKKKLASASAAAL